MFSPRTKQGSRTICSCGSCGFYYRLEGRAVIVEIRTKVRICVSTAALQSIPASLVFRLVQLSVWLVCLIRIPALYTEQGCHNEPKISGELRCTGASMVTVWRRYTNIGLLRCSDLNLGHVSSIDATAFSTDITIWSPRQGSLLTTSRILSYTRDIHFTFHMGHT